MRKSFELTYLIFLLLLFQTCTSKKENLEKLTIGTFSRAIDYSPFYIAKYFQWFNESESLKRLDISFTEYNDRATFSALLDKNQLNVIFAAEPPIIITKAQGIDLKITEISCTLQQEIVIRSDLNISNPSQLSGTKLAVLLGTSSHYGLLKILSANGLSVDNVEILYQSPVEARINFEQGNIDGWAVWPPFVEEQQVNGNGKVLSGGDAIIQSVMAMPTKFINEHPEEAKELVNVIRRSKKWIQENPEKAISIVAKELSLDDEIVRTAWPKHSWSAVLNKSLVDDIQKKANFLAKQGATRNNVIIDVNSDLIQTIE